jgi:hypothetical protein
VGTAGSYRGRVLAGSSLRKIYSGSPFGRFSMAFAVKPKFCCRISGGVCFSQSDKRRVLSSEKLP